MNRFTKSSKSPRWLTLSSSFLLLTAPVVSLTLNHSPIIAQETVSQQLSEQRIEEIARSITVSITAGNSKGSGVLIKKEGQTYTVLTNQHVTEGSKTFSIETLDGKTHTARLVPLYFQGKDAALLQFTSNNDYAVARLGNLSSVNTGDKVFIGGFPFAESESAARQFVFRGGDRGRVSEKLPKPLQGGYLLGYTNEVDKGMSGGPILNSQGELIGINGLHDQPLFGNPYVYEDGEIPSDELITDWKRSSWGIPLEVIAQIAPNYLPTLSQPTATPLPNELASMPEFARDIDQIAEKVSVLIPLSGGNGSGVIIAKEGNTYHILTAKHVLPIDTTDTIKIITHDGQEHSSQRISEFESEGVDLALLKFSSDKNYEVVTIGDYDRGQETNLSFVSGWPASRNANAQTFAQTREFAPGYVFSYNTGNNLAHDKRSLEFGNDLIYTNITDEGMSGGPVLDAEGRLIGIHTIAEGIKITEREIESPIRESEVKNIRLVFGYSGGISSKRLVRLLEKYQIRLGLVVNNNAPQPISDAKKDQVITALVSVKEPDNKTDAIAWVNYGNKLWRLRRYQQAYQAFSRAAQINSGLFEAWYGRGLALVGDKHDVSDDDWKKSLEDFKKAKDINPDSDIAWRQIGDSYWYLGEYQLSLEAFQKAIELNKNDFILYNWISSAYQELGRYPEALEAGNQAIARSKSQGIESAESYYRRARTRSFLQDYAGAIADTDKAIEIDPDLGIIYLLRGNFRRQQEDPDTEKVLADYNKAIELSPNDPFAYTSRGIFYAQIGKPEQFKQDFDQAVSLDPINGQIYADRGYAYYLLGNTQQAFADYTEAIRLAEEQAHVHYTNRGETRRSSGDLEGAIQDYTEALKFRNSYVLAYLRRGIAYAQLGDKNKAFQDLDKALELTPDNSWLYTWRGDAYFNLGEIEAGKKEYDVAISKSRELAPIFYATRGSRLRELEDYEAAALDYQAAIRLGGDNASYYNQLGILSDALDQREEAIQYYTEAIRLDPDEVVHYFNRGDSYQRLEKYELAFADFNKAIALNPNSASYHNRLAIILYSREQYEEAIKYLTEAIRLDSDQAVYYGNRGDNYQRLEKYELAFADFNKAIALNPNNTRYYQDRGLARRRLGDYTGAIEDYTQSIEVSIKLTSEPTSNQYDLRGAAYSFLGDSYWQKDDKTEANKYFRKAIEDYNRALEINPDNLSAFRNRARTYEVMGQSEAAIQDFLEIANRSPDQLQSYSQLIDAVNSLEDKEAALQYYSQLIQAKPDSAALYAGRGNLYKKQEQYQQAIADYTKAIELEPEESVLYGDRGDIHRAMQNYQESISDYEKGIELALSEQKWFYADNLTDFWFISILLSQTGESQEIQASNFQNLSCNKLQMLNDLWEKYSEGKFGFKIQTSIYLDTGNQPGQYDQESFERFGQEVGWRDEQGWIASNDNPVIPIEKKGSLPQLPYDLVIKDGNGQSYPIAALTLMRASQCNF